jgi:hypothetical protein
VILFRHADPRLPFLWEGPDQPPARWHGRGEGPVHYFADTPDGAWAELVRHEEIRTAADLATLRRDLWAVDVREWAFPMAHTSDGPMLDPTTMLGDTGTYAACRAEARRMRATGKSRMVAPSAALQPGAARGFTVNGGLVRGPGRDGLVFVLFGKRPDLVGWRAVSEGRPGPDLLTGVKHF